MSDNKISEEEIEIVNGNGNNLDISPVFEHLNVLKPKSKSKKKLVIPEVKKNK